MNENKIRMLFILSGLISACLAVSGVLFGRAIRALDRALGELQRKERDTANDVEVLGEKVDFLSRELDQSDAAVPEDLKERILELIREEREIDARYYEGLRERINRKKDRYLYECRNCGMVMITEAAVLKCSECGNSNFEVSKP